jgi:hypothetical protein
MGFQGILLVFCAVLSSLVVAAPSARADYLNDVVRAGAKKRAGQGRLNLEGIQQVASLDQLDFQAGLTEADLSIIESSLIARLGARHEVVKTQLPTMMASLRQTRRVDADGYRVRNTFIYLGASSGWFVGASGNVGLAFAKTKSDGYLAVFPILFARVNFVQFGSEAHLGLGVLEDAPVINVSAGMQLGGAFFVGAGAGGGEPLLDYDNRNGEGGRSGWVEFRIGFEFDFGPYIEVMI